MNIFSQVGRHCRATFIAIAIVASVAGLHAATEQMAIVTITNVPAGLTTNIVVNIGSSTTRNWTNDTTGTASTSIQTTNSNAASVTNLVTHFGSYPVYSAGAGSPQAVVQLSGTNTAVFWIIAPLNTNLTVTFGGNWASLYYVTNTYSDANPILTPTNQMSARVRTNAANALVNLLAATNMVPSNAVPPGAKFLRNYTDNTSSQNISNKTLTAPVLDRPMVSNAVAISGVLTRITNGYSTNMVLDAPKMTNGVSYSGFSAPGTGLQSERFGNGAIAAGDGSLALGYSAIASNDVSQIFGTGLVLENGLGIGLNNIFVNSNNLGIGRQIQLTGNGNIGLGNVGIGHEVQDNGYINVILIGNGLSAATSNRVLIGGSTYSTEVQGPLITATITNSTHTGTNRVNGSMAWTRYDLSSLANGNNISVPFGTNKFIRLSGTLTGTAAICGIIGGATSGGQNGQEVNVLNDTGYSVTFAVNTSDPVAANRISTVSGTDIVVQTGGWITLFYDSNASRWKVKDSFPTLITTADSLTLGTLGASNIVGTNILARFGSSASNVWVGGTAFFATNLVANPTSNGTPAALRTITIPANGLYYGGDTYYARWEIVMPDAQANTNQFQITYGTTAPTTLFDSGLQVSSNCTATVEAWLTQLNPTNLHTRCRLEWGPGGGVPFVFTNRTITLVAQTNSIDNSLILLSTARRQGSHTNSYAVGEYRPAPR